MGSVPKRLAGRLSGNPYPLPKRICIARHVWAIGLGLRVETFLGRDSNPKLTSSTPRVVVAMVGVCKDFGPEAIWKWPHTWRATHK